MVILSRYSSRRSCTIPVEAMCLISLIPTASWQVCMGPRWLSREEGFTSSACLTLFARYATSRTKWKVQTGYNLLGWKSGLVQWQSSAIFFSTDGRVVYRRLWQRWQHRLSWMTGPTWNGTGTSPPWVRNTSTWKKQWPYICRSIVGHISGRNATWLCTLITCLRVQQST